jgi:hypothetical protein
MNEVNNLGVIYLLASSLGIKGFTERRSAARSKRHSQMKEVPSEKHSVVKNADHEAAKVAQSK